MISEVGARDRKDYAIKIALKGPALLAILFGGGAILSALKNAGIGRAILSLIAVVPVMSGCSWTEKEDEEKRQGISSPVCFLSHSYLRLWLVRRILATCSLRVVAVLLFSVGTASADTASEWLTFRNAELHFRFLYPADWRVLPPRGPNVKASVAAPASMLSNCNMTVRLAPELNSYSQDELNSQFDSEIFSEEDWIGFLGEKFPDAKITERKRTKVDNVAAQMAVIGYTYETVDAKIYGRMIQVIAARPGKLYMFTCGSGGLSNEQAQRNYGQHAVMLRRILGSLVFEDP